MFLRNRMLRQNHTLSEGVLKDFKLFNRDNTIIKRKFLKF